MTNLERLRKMDPEELSSFCARLYKEPLMEYVDWNTWFSSEDEAFCYIGEDGWCCPGRAEACRETEMVPCRILGDAAVKGKDYKKVLIGGRVYYYPASRVIKEGECWKEC